jgi:hypothetical protein
MDRANITVVHWTSHRGSSLCDIQFVIMTATLISCWRVARRHVLTLIVTTAVGNTFNRQYKPRPPVTQLLICLISHRTWRIIKHHAMKTYVPYGMWSWSSTLFTFGTSWKRVISFTPLSLSSRGKSPRYPLAGCRVEPRAGLDAVERRKISHPSQGLNSDPSTIQPVPRRCTYWTTLAPK